MAAEKTSGPPATKPARHNLLTGIGSVNMMPTATSK